MWSFLVAFIIFFNKNIHILFQVRLFYQNWVPLCDLTLVSAVSVLFDNITNNYYKTLRKIHLMLLTYVMSLIHLLLCHTHMSTNVHKVFTKHFVFECITLHFQRCKVNWMKNQPLFPCHLSFHYSCFLCKCNIMMLELPINDLSFVANINLGFMSRMCSV